MWQSQSRVASLFHIKLWDGCEQLEEVSSMENLLKTVQRAGETNLLYVEEHLARHHGKRDHKAAAAAE